MDFKYLKTISTSHVSLYFGVFGLTLNVPFKNLVIIGSFPMESSDIKEIADLWVFSDPYDAPNFNWGGRG